MILDEILRMRKPLSDSFCQGWYVIMAKK